jgi:hypothetical protein
MRKIDFNISSNKANPRFKRKMTHTGTPITIKNINMSSAFNRLA